MRIDEKTVANSETINSTIIPALCNGIKKNRGIISQKGGMSLLVREWSIVNSRSRPNHR